MTLLRLPGMISGDFQWTGARMLGHGVSPYLIYFQHGHDPFILAQIPTYLPLLYVLLVPLGLLSFHTASSIWAMANIFMALASSILLGRAVGLAGWPLAGLTGLVLVSEPFSVALGNGQLTFVVVFFAVLAQLTSRALPGGSASALVLMKYSFAPLLLVPLVRRRWGVLAVAAAVELAALGVFSKATGSNLASTLFAPLKVASTGGMSRGAADVMSLSAWFGAGRALQFALALVTVWPAHVGSPRRDRARPLGGRALCVRPDFPGRATAPGVRLLRAAAGRVLGRATHGVAPGRSAGTDCGALLRMVRRRRRRRRLPGRPG